MFPPKLHLNNFLLYWLRFLFNVLKIISHTYWASSGPNFKSKIFVSVVPALGVKSYPVNSDISCQCLSVKWGLHNIPMVGIHC